MLTAPIGAPAAAEFIKLGADQTAIAGWLEYANNPRDYGGGWWYGCLGWSSD